MIKKEMRYKTMKQLVYRLTNGTIVKTLRDAVSSGQGYSTEFITLSEPTAMSKTRAKMLKQNGKINPPSHF